MCAPAENLPLQEHPEVSTPDVEVAAPLQKPRSRRGAVSASVMTEEQATSYVKKVSLSNPILHVLYVLYTLCPSSCNTVNYNNYHGNCLLCVVDVDFQ